MELKDQVTSRELSEKLKDLGVVQDGLWYWVNHFGHWHVNINKEGKCYSAFTVAELGRILPKSIKIRAIAEGEHGGRYYFYSQHDQCFYAMNNGQTRLFYEEADTEANARALMYIYLIKNKLVEVGE